MPELRLTDARCQFCHRTSSDVEHIIHGDSGFICSDCVQACHALLQPSIKSTPEEVRSERQLHQRLARHFSPQRPSELIATSRTYPLRQQADQQKAIDDLFGERRIPDTFVGVHQQYRHEILGFSKLLEQGRNAVEAAPAMFEDVDIGGGEVVHCLKNGVWFLRDDDLPYAVVLAQHDDYGRGGDLIIEIMVPPGEAGAAVCARAFDALELRLSTGSCYRGRVLSLERRYEYAGHASRICVHDLGAVPREEVILPEAVLQAVERNVLAFAEQRETLRAIGLSTQKGLLFHGAPGTGKTHCIRYLAARLPGHTTLLITAEGAGLLPEYMALARLLQPAMVVIEDADLLARDRSSRSDPCDEAMLNRLLNEMDGLREKADVFFVLTTNRASTLEPALADRPGRIDQTIEFPLPDVELRQRLVRLYAKALPVPPALIRGLAERTDGASPAFIKELLRRVAQHHFETGGRSDVKATVADSALHEMLFSGGSLNTRLLGGVAPVR